jgi:N-acyl homoserine lactone hydrolase
MSLRLFGCVCGQFHSPAAGMGLSGDRVAVPIPFYVIERDEGVTLFDAGLPAAMCDRNDSYRCLERLDIDPARVRQVVVSHLHFDHAGGLKELPNATLIVQRREWEAGFEREVANHYGLRKRYFDLGHQVRLIDGEHDLFGDGSAVCIPSFGHTPGHQSLRVRGPQGDHILVGDACYNAQTVENRRFPEFSDAAVMNRSLDDLLSRREAGTVMVFGHDADQWGQAPVLPSRRA